MLNRQIREYPYGLCPCAAEHGGSGRYVFHGPDGGHYRRSNYARRVFRPACDGRLGASLASPGRLVIADTTTWPGTPIAFWPPAPSADASSTGENLRVDNYTPPRGHGIQPIPSNVPISSWLPIQSGLTPHGLRHSHKTWMFEDNIPEILAEQRLGHQVPGIRGLYAHASDRMRDDLKAALQQRWTDALTARAAIHPHSPPPLLNERLAPIRNTGQKPRNPARSSPTRQAWRWMLGGAGRVVRLNSPCAEPDRCQFWMAGRMVMSPISTSSGCSMANATARATASGPMPSVAILLRACSRISGSSM